MRYIVVGGVAVLATRGLERVESETIPVTVVGVPDGAAFCLQNGGTVKSFTVDGETVNVHIGNLDDAVYDVTIITEIQGQRYEINGNPFSIFTDGGDRFILPAPLSTATELENMWSGIVNVLETFVPLIDTLQNGNDAV